jgi:phosphoribosyl-ATP pyrophosphohydrolase
MSPSVDAWYAHAVTFEEIVELALSRKAEMPSGSATTALLEAGTHAIGKKLVEEAAESWMAARYESDDELATELSQLLYYVAVLMADRRIALSEVYSRL